MKKGCYRTISEILSAFYLSIVVHAQDPVSQHIAVPLFDIYFRVFYWNADLLENSEFIPLHPVFKTLELQKNPFFEKKMEPCELTNSQNSVIYFKYCTDTIRTYYTRGCLSLPAAYYSYIYLVSCISLQGYSKAVVIPYDYYTSMSLVIK